MMVAIAHLERSGNVPMSDRVVSKRRRTGAPPAIVAIGQGLPLLARVMFSRISGYLPAREMCVMSRAHVSLRDYSGTREQLEEEVGVKEAHVNPFWRPFPPFLMALPCLKGSMFQRHPLFLRDLVQHTAVVPSECVLRSDIKHPVKPPRSVCDYLEGQFCVALIKTLANPLTCSNYYTDNINLYTLTRDSFYFMVQHDYVRRIFVH